MGIATVDEAREELHGYASGLFAVNAETLLGTARAPLERLAHITDATAAEIAQARQAEEEAKQAVGPTAALFDVLTAARLDKELQGNLKTGATSDLIGNWMKQPDLVPTSPEWERARKILRDLPPFHFPVAFPEVFLSRSRPGQQRDLRGDDRSGFDCILGNPPWEKAKVEEHSFWGRYSPGVRHWSGMDSARLREEEIAKLRLARPDLVALLEAEVAEADLTRLVLLRNPTLRFGSGDPDAFVAFAWRFWQLMRADGCFGVVLPRQIAMSEAAEHVRRRWITEGRVIGLTFLLNRNHWACDDMEPRYTIALTCVQRKSEPPEETADEADAQPVQYEVQVVGLLRSALLKRFESSVYASARTCARMVETHDRFLWALGQGYVARAEVLVELENVDNDEALEELMREYGQDESAGYEVGGLRGDVEHDRNLLSAWAETAGRITREHDPKLKALVEELAKIARQAEKEGLDETDKRNKRKALIFSYYADTVDWIEEHLREVVQSDKRLACYQGRLASVASDDSRGGASRKAAIYGFAPISTEAPRGCEDRFDLLICTDVLAEGMNLQQCRHVINYDLPWNPMRIVQRNGRIDRIGSPYDRVYARCIFPDERLNELLDLEGRIRRKLAQAAVTVPPDTEPVPDAPMAEQVYTESREEIECLVREDPTLLVTAGEDPSAHSGEEYRQELSRGMERHGKEVRRLPWAAGSGYVAEGKQRGWAFCARVGDRPLLRFVPANGGEVQRDTLSCLKQFTCAPTTGRVEERARRLPELVTR